MNLNLIDLSPRQAQDGDLRCTVPFCDPLEKDYNCSLNQVISVLQFRPFSCLRCHATCGDLTMPAKISLVIIEQLTRAYFIELCVHGRSSQRRCRPFLRSWMRSQRHSVPGDAYD